MPEFKLKVDEVQRVLERIRANTAKMNEQREQYRSATTTATEKRNECSRCRGQSTAGLPNQGQYGAARPLEAADGEYRK